MGQESYSRKAYEAAVEDHSDAQSDMRTPEQQYEFTKLAAARSSVREAGDIMREYIAGQRHAEQRAAQALEQMRKLTDAGHAEANELNKEYDKLLAVAIRANDALHSFEVDKLGLPPVENEDREEVGREI